jgi:hypothetical protein
VAARCGHRSSTHKKTLQDEEAIACGCFVFGNTHVCVCVCVEQTSAVRAASSQFPNFAAGRRAASAPHPDSLQKAQCEQDVPPRRFTRCCPGRERENMRPAAKTLGAQGTGPFPSHYRERRTTSCDAQQCRVTFWDLRNRTQRQTYHLPRLP